MMVLETHNKISVTCPEAIMRLSAMEFYKTRSKLSYFGVRAHCPRTVRMRMKRE